MNLEDFLPHPPPGIFPGTTYFTNGFAYLQCPSGPPNPATWTLLQRDPNLACNRDLAAASSTAAYLRGIYTNGDNAIFQGIRYNAIGQNPAWLFWDGVQ